MTEQQTQTDTGELAEAANEFDSVLEETQRRRENIRDTAAEKIGCKPNGLFKLLRNQWPQKGEPLSDGELFQAISLIARYDLDPLTKEIHCFRDKWGKICIVVGIDGWIKILHRTPDYDGHEQNMQFSEDGAPLSVTTTIYSNERSHPTKYTGYFAEYKEVCGPVAKNMPIHMFGWFGLRHATRQFTPIGGNVVTPMESDFIRRGGFVEPEHEDQSYNMLIAALKKRGADKAQADYVCQWAGTSLKECHEDPEKAVEVQRRIAEVSAEEFAALVKQAQGTEPDGNTQT